MKKVAVIIAAIALVAASQTFAANLAGDNASNAPYADGWQSGDNGGFGFGAWTLTAQNSPNGSGHFIGSSTANGDGLDNGIVGGLPNDGDIDSAGVAWGMYANGGNTADATRPFTGGTLSIGQSVSFDFDNGYIDSGTVGVGLQNAAGNNLWEMFFAGGNANYSNNDAAGVVATTVGYGDEGLKVKFTLTGAASYTVVYTRRDGVNQTINGNLIANADQGIAQLRWFNFNAGPGTDHNAYLNNLSIVPEPTTLTLVGLGMLGALALRRRK